MSSIFIFSPLYMNDEGPYILNELHSKWVSNHQILVKNISYWSSNFLYLQLSIPATVWPSSYNNFFPIFSPVGSCISYTLYPWRRLQQQVHGSRYCSPGSCSTSFLNWGHSSQDCLLQEMDLGLDWTVWLSLLFLEWQLFLSFFTFFWLFRKYFVYLLFFALSLYRCYSFQPSGCMHNIRWFE